MQRIGKHDSSGEMASDWNAITEATARQLKGEPNSRLSNRRELRWGSHGSFKLIVAGQDIGNWYDWEAREGGRGAIRLAEYLLAGCPRRSFGLVTAERVSNWPSNGTHASADSIPTSDEAVNT